MTTAAFLLVLGCAAEDASPRPGLVARLDVKPAPGGVSLTLQLRNASLSPISITAVEEWNAYFPDLIYSGAEAEATLRIERLSGAVPWSFAVLDGPFHSTPREHRTILLQPGASRSFPKPCLLPPGEYEASATYLYVDGEPLTTRPLRFRVEGTIRR